MRWLETASQRCRKGEGMVLVAIRGTDDMIVWDYEGFRRTSLLDSIAQKLHDLTQGYIPPVSSADVWKATMLAQSSEGHTTTADFHKRFTTTCASCGVTKASLQQCSKCGMCHYCGKDCQRRDWEIHKMECKSNAIIWRAFMRARDAEKKKSQT
jgi:hypothetical protein